MKIIGVKVHKLPRESLVVVLTDESIEGYSVVDHASAEELVRRFAVSEPWLVSSKPFQKLIGADPFDIEKIEKSQYSQYFYQSINNGVLCALDECLWDIIGKSLKLPVYKLLGSYREKILAYASTPNYEKEEDYIDLALKCKEKGYKALKIHPFRNWKKDISLCKAVRDAVGDEMILMLDPFNAYSREEALKVGRVIEKLDFYWYEDPIPTTDIDGLVDLCRSLDIEVLIGEHLSSLYEYSEYIRRHATDALRCIDVKVGGITSMMKIAHLAEAFGMKCEPHSWGSTITQAAHLHVMLAIENCDFFELPVPEGVFDRGFKNKIRIDKDGYVHAPNKPGLGIEIDWDEIEKNTIKTLEYP